jgi:hypothetical protein
LQAAAAEQQRRVVRLTSKGPDETIARFGNAG